MEGTTHFMFPYNVTGMEEASNSSYSMPSSSGFISEELRNQTILVSFVMFGAGVFGNVLALIVMARAPHDQRKTSFYKLMAGLAFTDLVGTCATSPVVLNVYMKRELLETDMPLCHYFSFMMIFAGFATMSLVCFMAIERYICLCYPYVYYCKLPKSYAKYSLIASWVLSLFIACLPLIGVGTNTVQYPNTWCFFDSTSRKPKDVAFSVIYAVIALIAILITFICNFAAIITVLALRRRQNALTALQGTGIKRYRSLAQRCAELHMVVMLIGVTVIFTSCFGPLMIFTIICQTNMIEYIDTRKMYLFMIRLASFNPILDPWVYLLVRRELRWKVICVIKSILGIKKRPLTVVNAQSSQSLVMAQRPGKQTTDTDMSCWTFCLHCLCDPPTQRSSSSMSRASMSWAGQSTLSPSNIRRMPSTDSIIANGSSEISVITQPSASDSLLLKTFTPKKENKSNGVT